MLSIKDQIEKEIRHLKNPSDHLSIARLPIRDKDMVRAYLRPVPSKLLGQAKNDALLMAQWRNKHRNSFFTSFHATEERTKSWLVSRYADNNTDITFMIDTLEQVPFGHIALYNFDFNNLSCELGRVLRGCDEGSKGGMTLASKTLLDWAFITLNIREVYLEVFENSLPAISIYKGLGFEQVQRIPLRLVDEGDKKKWIKIDRSCFDHIRPERFALKMVKSLGRRAN